MQYPFTYSSVLSRKIRHGAKEDLNVANVTDPEENRGGVPGRVDSLPESLPEFFSFA